MTSTLQLELAQELLLACTPKRCSSSTMIRPRSLARTSRDSRAVGADEVSTLPSAKAWTAARCSRGAEAGDVLDRERVVVQALGEGAVVLLRQDRRGHEHQHLLAVLGGDEGRAQRDLGLAVADVAADEPVHRPRGLHVGLDRARGVALVRGLACRGRACSNLRQPFGLDVEGVARCGACARRRARAARPPSPGPPCGRAPSCAPGPQPPALLSGGSRAAGADVATVLSQLVDRHEHAVGALGTRAPGSRG